MQGMDGLKTAMRIKEKYPKLPVVLVTAYMNYALDGYKVKASRFLLKDNLADTICRLPRLLTQQGLTTIERVDDAG